MTPKIKPKTFDVMEFKKKGKEETKNMIWTIIMSDMMDEMKMRSIILKWAIQYSMLAGV